MNIKFVAKHEAIHLAFSIATEATFLLSKSKVKPANNEIG